MMIKRTDITLQIDNHCRQASCHFDKHLYHEGIPGQLGLALPSTLAGAVQKRKAEFIAGRYCAREALGQLGDKLDAAIGIGAHREPLWPPGFVGSITHTHGFASAVVGSRTRVRAVGIDSETWVAPAIVDEVERQVLTAGESYADHQHLFESRRHYLTLVFSAKESLYKCLFPLVNQFFGFHAAVISPQASGSATGGQFRYELLEDLNADFCKGYSGYGSYSIRADFVHSAVVLKACTFATHSDSLLTRT